MTPAIIAPDSPPTTEILEMTKDISRSMWPGVIVLPEMSAGATDSVYSRALGIPSYGIDGAFDDLDDARAHGRDERISVVAFAEELEFTYRFMRAIGDAR
jgi:acetylornithine deacetylase/succinyl-diaminopimelate desuccinylase-like protein